MKAEMIGKRVAPIPQEGGFQVLQPGEYMKWKDREWYGCTPNGEGCNLSGHEIVEHEDGTITVSPSIRVTVGMKDGGDRELWHGHLERGVWKEC